jgi:hypothetical protein
MPWFTQTEYDLATRAYDLASDRIANLEQCNQTHASDVRQAAIDSLRAHQEQIQALGIYEENDVSLQAIQATVQAANEILEENDHLEDTHELTLIELETDLTDLLQKLSLDEYMSILKLCWLTERRRTSFLPREIPAEVCDEFHVALFSKCQGRLNQIAYQSRDASRLKCLNSDDYAPIDFAVTVLNSGNLAAQEAIDNYITLQQLKEAERAQRAESELSVGGMAWDIFGWDSPTDFLIDVGLFVVTGGGYKVARWVNRVRKVQKKAKRAAKALEKLMKLQDRARRLEHRMDQIRRSADKLRKARAIVDFPRDLAALLSKLARAADQLEALQEIGKTATKDYVRTVATSAVAKSIIKPTSVGTVASKEAVLTSMRLLLDGTPVGKKLNELRKDVTLAALIAGRGKKTWKRLWSYLLLLIARDLVVRLGYSFAHKRALTVETVVDDLIDSFTSAVETIVVDVTGTKSDTFVRTVMQTNRKFLTEIAKRLAKDLVDA